MSNWCCVKPTTRTLNLSFLDNVEEEAGDGQSIVTPVRRDFWIKVKERLTIGEKKRVQTSAFGGMRSEKAKGENKGRVDEVSIDWSNQSFARTEAYLVDWSLESDVEKHVKLPLNRETIESLREEIFEAIETALNVHVEEMTALKNQTAGVSKPLAISA